MKEIKVIGLDLDGTLYDSTPEIQGRIRNRIYQKIAEKFEIFVDKARELFEKGYAEYHSGRKATEEIARIYGQEINGSDLIQDAIEEADILDLIKPHPSLARMLGRIAGTKQLDILTGSRYDFALAKLDRLGINYSFFRYILADEDGSKSYGDMYSKWLAFRKDVAHNQHLYVGDNKKQDIEIPARFGIRTCFLGKENADGADFHIRNILELERIIQEQP